MNPHPGSHHDGAHAAEDGATDESIAGRVEDMQRVAGRLARRLLRDPARADDVAQKAVLASLSTPPHAGWTPLAWISGITRNLARKERRGDARRLRHERGAARPETVPSTAELLGRLDEHRALLAAVRALDEPYREAILLRYFRGMPPRDIARSRALPIDTVRSHLRRGLAQLRERLDATHGGDRRAWCVALLPLAQGEAAPAAPPIPVISAIAATVLAVGGGTALLLSGDGAPHDPPQAPAIAGDASPGDSSSAANGESSLAAAGARPAPLRSAMGSAWITGRVTAGGRPAPGVRVVASMADDTNDRRPLARLFEGEPAAVEVASDVSGADGRFRLRGLAPLARVHVEALPGGASVGDRRDLRPADLGAEGLHLTVQSTIPLRGRVALPSPARAPARIRFSSWNSPAFWGEASSPTTTVVVAHALPDGSFSVALPAGRYSCSIAVAGQLLWWTCSGVGAPWEGEKRFGPGDEGSAAIGGTVVDAQDRPIAGARVGISVSTETDGGQFAATTAVDGTYRIGGLPAGHPHVDAIVAAGYGPPIEKRAALPLVPGRLATLDLRLPVEVTVFGRVTLADGRAVADARVTIARPSDAWATESRTDAEGRYRVGGLPAGDLSLRVDGGTGTATAPLDRLREGAREERDLVLTSGPRLPGIVLDPAERPVEGAWVTAQSIARGTRLGYAARPGVAWSGADGQFVLEGLVPAEDWVVEGRTQDPGALAGESARVRVPERGEVAPLVLRLARLGSIDGRVVGPDGLGAAGATLRVRSKGLGAPRPARTDASGRFAVEGIPPGTATVEVINVLKEHPSATATVAIVGNTTRAEVVLRVGAEYFAKGTIVGADGKPVVRSPATLELVDAPPDPPREVSVTTDDRGAFEAVGLVAGSYRVKVGDVEAPSLLEAGTLASSFTLPAPGPAWVEGEVLDPEGRPVTAFLLSTWTYREGGSQGSEDSVKGSHFRVKAPRLPAGFSWCLSITAVEGVGGSLLDVQPHLIESVPTGPVQVRLLAGRALVGRVLGDDGAPAAGVTVYAIAGTASSALDHHPAAQPRSATSAADGSFRVTGLPHGGLRIWAAARAPFLAAPQPVLVEAGASMVELVLVRGRSVTGTVLLPDGAPGVGFRVSLSPEGIERLPYHTAAVAADGTFKMDGIPAVERVGLRVSRGHDGTSAPDVLPTLVSGVVVDGPPVTIHLRVGVFIEGTAVGPDGVVVERGSVVADVRARARDGAPVFVDGRLDAGGRFRIGPLEPGPVLLFYETPFAPWASLRPLAVNAPARDVRVPVAAAATLRGRVTDLRGATGWARWNPGYGNSPHRSGIAIGVDGGFGITGTAEAPGLLYVAVPADDRYALREGHVIGAEVLELTLSQGQGISGRLSGLPSGSVPPQSVVARRGDLVCFGVTEPDGTFRIPAVPPGTYRVEIEYGPYAGALDGVDAGATDVVVPTTRR